MRTLSLFPPPSAFVTNLINPPQSSPALPSPVSAKQSIDPRFLELLLPPLEEFEFSLFTKLILPTAADEFWFPLKLITPYSPSVPSPVTSKIFELAPSLLNDSCVKPWVIICPDDVMRNLSFNSSILDVPVLWVLKLKYVPQLLVFSLPNPRPDAIWPTPPEWAPNNRISFPLAALPVALALKL